VEQSRSWGPRDARYARVTLVARGDLLATFSILGHELQHVAEIARDPLIIDADSMATEYLSFGAIRIRSARLSAETGDAIGVAAQVMRELQPRRGELVEAQQDWQRRTSRGTR
jgi:hypothetical protein